MNRRAWTGLVAAACSLSACGSSSLTTTGGACSTAVPAGQACNTMVVNGSLVPITCTIETMPTGQGGTISPGRYDLTQMTYYNATSCPPMSLHETIELTAGCLQLASDSLITGTLSGTFTVAGNAITTTQTCMNFDSNGGTETLDAPIKTFTATPTTFTLFSVNSAGGSSNPGSIAVFTKP